MQMSSCNWVWPIGQRRDGKGQAPKCQNALPLDLCESVLKMRFKMPLLSGLSK